MKKLTGTRIEFSPLIRPAYLVFLGWLVLVLAVFAAIVLGVSGAQSLERSDTIAFLQFGYAVAIFISGLISKAVFDWLANTQILLENIAWNAFICTNPSDEGEVEPSPDYHDHR